MIILLFLWRNDDGRYTNNGLILVALQLEMTFSAAFFQQKLFTWSAFFTVGLFCSHVYMRLWNWIDPISHSIYVQIATGIINTS